MSNDIAVILQNAALVQTGLDDDTLAVAGSAMNQTKRISIKGGVFRKYVGGREVGAIEDRHMNVIFVKMAHTASRTYYPTGFKDGEKVSPVCWSSDSRVPDADVKNPPAKSCDQCPYSVKNSVAGNGSACRLSWRTAVIVPGDTSDDIYQLVLPSTSCWQKEENGKWGFRPYIQMLASNNVAASRVITRMQFDTKSPTPKLLFSPAGAVNPNDLPSIDAHRTSAVAEQYIKLTVYQPQAESNEEGEAPAQFETPAPVVKEATPAPKEAAPVVEESDVVVDEPVLRVESTPAPAKPTNVSDVVKKWSVKS